MSNYKEEYIKAIEFTTRMLHAEFDTPLIDTHSKYLTNERVVLMIKLF